MPTLSTISSIRTGVFLQPGVKGDAHYLQIKDFNNRGEFKGEAVTGIQLDAKLEHHLLVPGDILFAAKGSKNFAAVYSGFGYPALASSAFFVIRQVTGYLPEYLAWFINHPRIQKALKLEAKGSAIHSISLRALESLEVLLPDLATQKLIVEIDKLRSREREITYELEELKDSALDIQIFSKIKQ